jgi:hypothetical protein
LELAVIGHAQNIIAASSGRQPIRKNAQKRDSAKT